MLENTPNILFLGQVILCRCNPQAFAQGWMNMKNEITRVIVIGVLLHCQACASFHNLHDFVCYEATYNITILSELTTNLKLLTQFRLIRFRGPEIVALGLDNLQAQLTLSLHGISCHDHPHADPGHAAVWAPVAT